MTVNARDEHWMKLALTLAEKGRGFTSPNPVVGACVVKGNRLIASGYHTAFGGPHAEVEALRKAGKRAAGATLYVTLEPCSTFGKTPPCTEAIRNAKIKHVVIGAIDSNPKHAGRAIRLLKGCGVQVKVGVLGDEAKIQNEAFFKWMKTGLPFVVLKMAQTLDGKIATHSGKSRWISGREARMWVHDMRAASDAVLVGKNTALRDNPRLTVRSGRDVKAPWRIVLDEKGSISAKSRLFRVKGPVVLVCSTKYLKPVTQKFKHTGSTILPIPAKAGRLNLSVLVKKLGALGITSLLVEGGGEVAWSFIESKLVDKIAWIIAPKFFGGRDAKTSVEGVGAENPNRCPELQCATVHALGNDLLIEGYLKH